MRDNVLRDLARRAASDPEYLRRIRGDLGGTLSRYGYELTAEKLQFVGAVQQQTTGMSDEQVALALLGGLAKRSGVSPARPVAPGFIGTGPSVRLNRVADNSKRKGTGCGER